MSPIKSDRYDFTENNVIKAPSTEGVYCIQNVKGNVIYVGRGILRTRLTTHFRKQNPEDQCIWRYSPTHYRREQSDNSEQRERELILGYAPPCNKKIG